MTAENFEHLNSGPYREYRRVGFSRPDESLASHILLKAMLMPDEQLLEVGRISNGIYWKSFAMLIFSLVFLLVLAVWAMPLPLILLLMFFLTLKVASMFIFAYLAQYYMLLAVTDKRVIARFGILNLEVIQMAYSKIESSEVASTIPGRLFGYSSVFVSGTGGHILAIPYVINAMPIRQIISEIVMRRDEVGMPEVVPVAPISVPVEPAPPAIILDPSYV